MTSTIQFQKRLGLILVALGFINEEQLIRLQDENAKHAGEKYGETAIRMGLVTGEQVATALDVQSLQGRLGAILVALGYVTEEQRDTLLAENRQQGEKIGDTAVRMELIKPDQLTQALCAQEIIQRRLGQILVALGFISREQHRAVIEANQRRQGEKFGETAVALGFVSDEQIINSVEVQQLDGRLGSILVALGDITSEQRDMIVDAGKPSFGKKIEGFAQQIGERFGEIAVRLGFINRKQLNRAVEVQRRMQIESLEVRQMMSVNPIGVDNLDATEDYQSTTAVYATQTTTAAEDNIDNIIEQINLACSDGHDHDDHDHDDHEDYPVFDEKLASQLENAGIVTQGQETALTSTSFDLNDTFKLHSNPGASLVIYIDFTGYTCTDSYWTSFNGGASIVAPAWSLDSDRSTFSDAELTQIYNIWQRVAEDYAPFDVDVTTEKPSDDKLIRSSSKDTEYGIHVVVDDNSTHWYGSAGGVAGRGTFTASRDRVAWVFSTQLNNDEKSMAEAISHEVGHTLGLTHDGTSSAAYYKGANGWAPIMGSGYYQAVTQWSKGEYSGANNKEDDLAIINKMLAYREDDHGNTFDTATVLDNDNGTFKSFGIIETNTDVDVFQFTLDSAWTLDINIKSGMRDANLDILARLCDADGTVIAVSDSPNTMDASFNVSLGPGTYYITIEGTGKVLSNGTVVYTDYGSLGNYAIHGTLTGEKAGSPVAPEGFVVADRSDRTVSLAWEPQDNVDSYTLRYRPAGSDSGWVTVAVGANASSVKINGLDPDTAYEFQLTATNAGGSAVSVLTASTNVAAPTAPVLQAAGSTTDTVTLSWNEQSNVTSYSLQYRAAGSNEWITAPAGNAAGTTVADLDASTTYEFRLTATNAGGSATSVLTASTIAAAPTAPVLNLAGSTADTVTLSWNEQNDVASYVLQYRVAGSNEWMIAESPAGNAVGATISGLDASTTYEFRLAATNTGGSAVSVLTASTQVVAPTAPVLNVVDSTTNSVTLSWNEQNDVAFYVLQYRVAGSNEWIAAEAPDGNTAGMTIGDLVDGTDYEFRLTAVNASGNASTGVSMETKVDTTEAEAAVAAAMTERDAAVAAAAKEAQEAAAAQETATAKQTLADEAAGAATIAGNTAEAKAEEADQAARTAQTAATAANEAAAALAVTESAAAKEAAEAAEAKTAAEQAALNKAAAEQAVADAQAAVAAAEAALVTAPTNREISQLTTAASVAALTARNANTALTTAKATGTSTNREISQLTTAASVAALTARNANNALTAAKAAQTSAKESQTALSAAQEALTKAQAELAVADTMQQNADQIAAKEAAEAVAMQAAADAARQNAVAFANESVAAAQASMKASAAAATARDAAEAALSKAQAAAKEAEAALADVTREVAEASAAQESAKAAEQALSDAVAALEALRK